MPKKERILLRPIAVARDLTANIRRKGSKAYRGEPAGFANPEGNKRLAQKFRTMDDLGFLNAQNDWGTSLSEADLAPRTNDKLQAALNPKKKRRPR